MAGSSTREVRLVKKDRISELPQNINETILGFLPIRDAVRTSILSTKWRHCWTTTPHLIFDDQTVRSMTDFSEHNHLNYHDRYHREWITYKFVSAVNKALLLHNGPIDTFSLTVPGCNSRDIVHDYIDQWIPLFSRKGIKKLTLKETYLLEESKAHNFSSLDLTHLKLIRVWFPLAPAVARFPYLTVLELVDATNNFRKSVFDCPVLEKLTLIICMGLFPDNFSAPNLKCLHQICRDITSEYSLAGFKNLAEFSFVTSRGPSSMTKTSNRVNVLDGLHKIEKFSTAVNAMKYLAAGDPPYRPAKPLTHLKTLNICRMNFNDLSEVSCLLCLIRSAPNLCELNISTNHVEGSESDDAEEGSLKNYCIEDPEDCNLDHLENVTFSFFKGLKTELELVKFLLAQSLSLKTMFIHRNGRITEGVALMMAVEMLQYPRGSSKAQIRPLKRPVEIDKSVSEYWRMYA